MNTHSSSRSIKNVAIAAVLLLGSATFAGCATDSESGPEDSSAGAPKASDGSLFEMLPEEFQDRGYITVVTDAKYPPYGFYDGSDLTGIDIDTAAALEDLLGIEVRIETASFEAFIPGLQSGRFDAGFNGITDKPDRRKQVDFVNFAKYGNVFLTRTDTDVEITELTSLCGVRVGAEKSGDALVVVDSISEMCASLDEEAVKESVFADTAAALTAMSSGRIDTVLMGSAAGYLANQSDGQLKVNGPLFGDPEGGFSTGGLAMPKDSPLIPVMVEAMHELKTDGTLESIYEEYGISGELLIDPEVNLGTIPAQ